MKTIWITAALLLGFATSANAIQGQWAGRYWVASDGTPVGNNYSDGNCFLPDGSWYSTNVVGLRGHWYQKGDQLYINTALLPDATVFSAQLEMVNPFLFTGQHQHWSANGSTTVLWYLKESLTYSGPTCLPPAR